MFAVPPNTIVESTDRVLAHPARIAARHAKSRHAWAAMLRYDADQRSLREAISAEICVSVSLLDGVVYARALFHFSINYRSAMIHGQPRKVDESEEQLHALRVITEHLAPGSWDYARSPTKRELAATAVLAMDLTEAAVKIRAGSPQDDAEDIADSSAWAGVLPLHYSWGTPQPADDLAEGIPLPPHISERR